METLKKFSALAKQGANKITTFVHNHQGVVRATLMLVLLASVGTIMAQSSAAAGTKAFTSVTTDLKAYVPLIRNLCFALAGIVAIGGSISVYIAMNNEEQDVKKKIMMVVGACVFLIAAATYLPQFFGLA